MDKFLLFPPKEMSGEVVNLLQVDLIHHDKDGIYFTKVSTGSRTPITNWLVNKSEVPNPEAFVNITMDKIKNGLGAIDFNPVPSRGTRVG